MRVCATPSCRHSPLAICIARGRGAAGTSAGSGADVCVAVCIFAGALMPRQTAWCALAHRGVVRPKGADVSAPGVVCAWRSEAN